MFGLWDSAETTYFLGIRVYSYGLYVMYGLALALAVMAFHGRKRKPAGAVALLGCLMLPLGFVFGRLFYLILDVNARQWPFFKALFRVTAGGFSAFGALAGAALGAVAGSALLRSDDWNRLKTLDVFAAGALIFIAISRLGERSVEDFGISFPLSYPAKGFLIINDTYGDYIAVYILESLYALILFVLCEMMMRTAHPDGDVFFTMLLLFGAGQILFESFRDDGHMAFSFVGAEHLMAAACVAAAGLRFALKGLKCLKSKALPAAVIVSLPLMVGILVGLEFALDRTEVSKVLLYGIYIAVIACPCVMSLILRKKTEEAA